MWHHMSYTVTGKGTQSSRTNVVVQKIKALLWKTYILRKRRWVITVLEFVVPIFVFWAVVHFKNMLPDDPKIMYNLNVNQYNELTVNGTYYVGYSPSNTFTNDIMTMVSTKLTKSGCSVTLVSRNNESEVVKWLRKQYNYSSSLDKANPTFESNHKGIGVIFLESQDYKQLKYVLRTISGNLDTTDSTRYGEQNGLSMYAYSYSGFTTIQTAIDQAYLYIVHSIEVSDNIYVGKLPSIEYNVVDLVKMLFPTIISLGFTFVMPSLLKEVVDEKTSGIKEMMKIMKLEDWANWLNWIVYSLIVYLPVTVIITWLFVMDSGSGAPVNVSFSVLWFMFVLFTLAFLTLVLAMSTLFTNGTVAMIVGEIVWYGSTIVLNTFIVNYPDRFSLYTKMLTCLCPSVALIWSVGTIRDFSRNGSPWTIRNLFNNGTEGNKVSVGLAAIMMLVDTVLFSVITWYMTNIKPGPFGLPKPYTFCFQRHNQTEKSSKDPQPYVVGPKNNYEIPPMNIQIGIKIENLRKTYNQGKLVAVENVDLDIYEGNITVLLGHNGAGKTTTMSILAGFLPPTRGKVFVKGKNIFDNMKEFRSNLGLCPQHNLLFSFFTVKEHLIFFGMLKGLSKSQSEQEGCGLMHSLKIFDKRNDPISKLSGGMKRKLCLAITLLGSPQVLILDEPTAGMDPESRRQVWDMLLASRKHRTTIISTHFMEEADVLGDRIAIMNHGQVSCYGTSMFLKKRFGIGYHLNITKAEFAAEFPITRTVKQYVTEATIRQFTPTLLSYNIRSDRGAQLQALFSALESKNNDLGLIGTNIASTTMEDIFLTVAKESRGTGTESEHIEVDNPVINHQKNSGITLVIAQLKALVYKRALVRIRSWISTLTYITAPVILMAATVMKMMEQNFIADQPKLMIGLSSFPGVTVALQSDNVTITRIMQDLVVAGSATCEHVFPGTELSQYLVEKMNRGLVQYEKEIIMGYEVHNNTIIGGYSQYFVHSPPLVLSMIANTILQLTSPFSTITVYNHPLAVKEFQDACDLSSNAFLHIFSFPLDIIFVSLGLVFLTMSFISFPLQERVIKAKQLQLMTGTSPLLYWFAIFLCDIAMYLLTATFMVSTIYLLETNQILSNSGYMGTLTFLFVLFGASGIAFAYFFSFMISSTVKASVLFIIINLVTGTFGGGFLAIIDSTYTGYGIWRYCLSFNPIFSMTSALIHLFSIMYIDGTCLQCQEDCDTQEPFTFLDAGPKAIHPHGINSFLIYLAVDTMIYFGGVLIIEYGILKRAAFLVSALWIGEIGNQEPIEDHDVEFERGQVLSSQKLQGLALDGYINKTPILHVNDLGKKYKRKKTVVNGVSFQVLGGECFGLLGVNGAGKTTTFRMLTGEEIPNRGDARIKNFSLKRKKCKLLSQIGYCPQFDAINKLLTGKEMLRVYALLRGIPSASCDSEISRWINIMGLEEYADRLCGTYSGGNKRKLSTAMAFIGEPPVVFLDEPTSGVDPVSRRKLWNVVSKCQQAGQAIVLTSHSMEECEALCSRLTIMVAGQMKCIGTTEYLKQKFARGFTVKIKLRCLNDSINLSKLQHDMESHFKNCSVKDQHTCFLHYHIPNPSLPLSWLFENMERMRHTYDIIEDYDISNTSLMEVFIHFARSRTNVET